MGLIVIKNMYIISMISKPSLMFEFNLIMTSANDEMTMTRVVAICTKTLASLTTIFWPLEASTRSFELMFSSMLSNLERRTSRLSESLVRACSELE